MKEHIETLRRLIRDDDAHITNRLNCEIEKAGRNTLVAFLYQDFKIAEARLLKRRDEIHAALKWLDEIEARLAEPQLRNFKVECNINGELRLVFTNDQGGVRGSFDLDWIIDAHGPSTFGIRDCYRDFKKEHSNGNP